LSPSHNSKRIILGQLFGLGILIKNI
jgi:hypothetical protein